MNTEEKVTFQRLAETTVDPIEMGRKGKKPLSKKQKMEWQRVIEVIQEKGEIGSAEMKPEELANRWKNTCKEEGVGSAVLLSLLFWYFVLPLLVNLAAKWIWERFKKGELWDSQTLS